MAVQRETWRILRFYFDTQARRLPIIATLSVATAAGQVTALVIIASAALSLAGGKDSVRISPGIFTLTISMPVALAVAAGAAFSMIVLQAINGWITSGLVAHAQTQTRRHLLDAFLATTWELASQERRGELQQLLTAHVAKVAQAVTFLNVLILSWCNLVILLAVAVITSPLIALALALGVNVLALPLRPIKARTGRAAKTHGSVENEFAAFTAGVVEQARETQLFEVAGGVTRRGRPLAQRVAGAQREVQFLLWIAPSTYAGVALLGLTVAVAIVAAVDVGNLAAIGSMVLLLIRSLTYAQSVQVSLQGLAEAGPYLSDIERKRSEYAAHPRVPGTTPLPQIDTIELERVSYRYPDRASDSLRDASLTIGAGTTIGVVGPTGSGKSTLAQVILRLREPSSGTYLVNRCDARDYDRISWARQVALVPQDPVIIDGTIAENIRFYRPWITDDDVRRAAREAHLYDEIANLTDAFDTRLSGIGTGLSGGQQQRLAIARALAGRPQLLILDEPTSALDMKSEALFHETVLDLKGRSTVLVIAHRLATIQICEAVVVIEHGRIQAVDTPGRLQVGRGFFADISDL